MIVTLSNFIKAFPAGMSDLGVLDFGKIRREDSCCSQVTLHKPLEDPAVSDLWAE
jgi:hypothetical protein